MYCIATVATYVMIMIKNSMQIFNASQLICRQIVFIK